MDQHTEHPYYTRKLDRNAALFAYTSFAALGLLVVYALFWVAA